jgi:hypothetical protein
MFSYNKGRNANDKYFISLRIFGSCIVPINEVRISKANFHDKGEEEIEQRPDERWHQHVESVSTTRIEVDKHI